MIRFDKYYRVPGGIGINEYFLSNHRNDIKPIRRTDILKGITICPIPVYVFEKGKSNVDLTIPHVENVTPNGLIPHFFVSRNSIWNVIDIPYCWQKKDGSIGDKTIGIAIAMSDELIPDAYKLMAIEHSAMLCAYLIKKYKLTSKDIFVTKDCPKYFTNMWKEFKQLVNKQLKKL